MKHLNSIYDFIFESVEEYKWELIEDTNNYVRYKFQDVVGNHYLVEFKNVNSIVNKVGTEFELHYFVYDDKLKEYSVSKMVNVNPYSTVKTVMGGIIQDFLRRKPWLKKIVIHGLSREKERDYISQRTKFYVRYLERNPLPGFRLQHSSNTINLIKI